VIRGPIYRDPWILVSLGCFVAGLFLVWWSLRQTKQRGRGFEVKSNMGEEPVIKKERDIDHG